MTHLIEVLQCPARLLVCTLIGCLHELFAEPAEHLHATGHVTQADHTALAIMDHAHKLLRGANQLGKHLDELAEIREPVTRLGLVQLINEKQ